MHLIRFKDKYVIKRLFVFRGSANLLNIKDQHTFVHHILFNDAIMKQSCAAN